MLRDGTGFRLKGDSLAARMDAQGGRATGFDYLKFGLALAVICFHSVITSYGADVERLVVSGPVRPLILAILPMFFALSGFLVTASLLRSKTMAEYVTLRVLRIVPALFVEVCVAALLLGPLLTTLPLADYFGNVHFYSYFQNIIGRIQFELPGLFLDNPDPGMVNRQLWTIPAELKCYVILSVISLIGIVRRPALMLAFVAAAALLLPIVDIVWKKENLGSLNNVTLDVLILSFLTGVAACLFKEKLKLNAILFAVAAIVSYVLLYFPLTQYIAIIPLTYVTIFIGLGNIPASFLSMAGNYSYGLYIYGYPIQQTFAYLFPNHRFWWLNIVFTLAFDMVLAALSWHFVEKPMLRQRPFAIAMANKLAAALDPRKWTATRLARASDAGQE
jgi:peptidoglycan/LPS O-acetylase OafA/YrhL